MKYLWSKGSINPSIFLLFFGFYIIFGHLFLVNAKTFLVGRKRSLAFGGNSRSGRLRHASIIHNKVWQSASWKQQMKYIGLNIHLVLKVILNFQIGS